LPISVLCGNDDAFLDCLTAGGTGGILASAHLFADALEEVQERVLSEKPEEAIALFDSLRPVINLLFDAPNPAGVKAALSVRGLISKETRMPIMEASEELTERLRVGLEICARMQAVAA
jgi:4-hydroxy-tetrahydrodipicolinate synthase